MQKLTVRPIAKSGDLPFSVINQKLLLMRMTREGKLVTQEFFAHPTNLKPSAGNYSHYIVLPTHLSRP